MKACLLYTSWEKNAWKTWMSFRDVDFAFQEFSISATTVMADSIAFSVLERFVVLMYHATSTAEHVNQARRILFTQMSRKIEHIPPTADALLQHLKRAMFQCNVWRNCLTKRPSVNDPRQWGWKTDDGTTFKPLWTTIPDVTKHCQELEMCIRDRYINHINNFFYKIADLYILENLLKLLYYYTVHCLFVWHATVSFLNIVFYICVFLLFYFGTQDHALKGNISLIFFII